MQIYQCKLTQECKNTKCFWKQRDCFGLCPFPMYYDSVSSEPIGVTKNNEIIAKYGEPYFPENEVVVGTNCMYIICKDFQE